MRNADNQAIFFEESCSYGFKFSNDQGFKEICIDNGAQVSVAGKKQYLAYTKQCAIPSELSNLIPSRSTFKFGEMRYESLAKATIRFLIEKDTFFEYQSEIVDLNIPILLRLDLQEKHGIVIDAKKKTA